MARHTQYTSTYTQYYRQTCCLLFSVKGSSVDTWNITSDFSYSVYTLNSPVVSAREERERRRKCTGGEEGERRGEGREGRGKGEREGREKGERGGGRSVVHEY